MGLCSTVRLPMVCSGLGDCEEIFSGVYIGIRASSLNRPLGAFSLSTLLTKTSGDKVNLSSTLYNERLTCILSMLAPHVLLRDGHAALF